MALAATVPLLILSGDGSPDSSGDWSERCNIWDGICIYIGVTNYTNHETEEETEETADYGGRLYVGSAQSGSDGRDFWAREAGFIHGAPQIEKGLRSQASEEDGHQSR